MALYACHEADRSPTDNFTTEMGRHISLRARGQSALVFAGIGGHRHHRHGGQLGIAFQRDNQLQPADMGGECP